MEVSQAVPTFFLFLQVDFICFFVHLLCVSNGLYMLTGIATLKWQQKTAERGKRQRCQNAWIFLIGEPSGILVYIHETSEFDIAFQ